MYAMFPIRGIPFQEKRGVLPLRCRYPVKSSTTKESYPEIALRETIANALIHQDFSISGTGPVVEVYADRWLILSGLLILRPSHATRNLLQ